MLQRSDLNNSFGNCIVALDNSHGQFRENILSNKQFNIQGLQFNLSVCMAAMGYSRPISAVLTNCSFLEEKNVCTISERYLKNCGTSSPIYKRTDRQTTMVKSLSASR